MHEKVEAVRGFLHLFILALSLSKCTWVNVVFKLRDRRSHSETTSYSFIGSVSRDSGVNIELLPIG
jgi:hypothetical protein